MKIDHTQFSPDLSRPSLEGLAQELRKGVADWDFDDCSRCAMGLAQRLWPKYIHKPQIGYIAPAFCLSYNTACEIFYRHAFNRYCDITPITIADRIDNYLALGAENQLTSP